MTEDRGSEQELWDEEIPDEDTKTFVFSPKTGLRPAASSGAARGAEASPSEPPGGSAESEPLNIPVSIDDTESVAEVTRFIAESGPLKPDAERELDAPRRSIAALEILDAEDGAESSDVRLPPTPPALPPDVKPSAPDAITPLLVVGSAGSARGDITERVTTIPRTHPMANSIAPGGSALSNRPAAPRKSSRWQLALGAAALLLIGGASRLLQSRGEHHAASGARGADEEGTPIVRPTSTPAVAPAPTPLPVATPEPAASAVLATVPATPESSAPASGPGNETVETIAFEPDPEDDTGVSAADKVKIAQAAAVLAEERARARRLRIGVGGAQLITRERAAADTSAASTELSEPDRVAIVQALAAVTPRLQDCVGDDHGIADVRLTVRAPGVVSHALVEGAYAGSEKGSCIARTLRSVKVPSLNAPISHLEYPFKL